jgi:hypothetical protein
VETAAVWASWQGLGVDWRLLPGVRRTLFLILVGILTRPTHAVLDGVARVLAPDEESREPAYVLRYIAVALFMIGSFFDLFTS